MTPEQARVYSDTLQRLCAQLEVCSFWLLRLARATEDLAALLVVNWTAYLLLGVECSIAVRIVYALAGVAFLGVLPAVLYFGVRGRRITRRITAHIRERLST